MTKRDNNHDITFGDLPRSTILVFFGGEETRWEVGLRGSHFAVLHNVGDYLAERLDAPVSRNRWGIVSIPEGADIEWVKDDRPITLLHREGDYAMVVWSDDDNAKPQLVKLTNLKVRKIPTEPLEDSDPLFVVGATIRIEETTMAPWHPSYAEAGDCEIVGVVEDRVRFRVAQNEPQFSIDDLEVDWVVTSHPEARYKAGAVLENKGGHIITIEQIRKSRVWGDLVYQYSNWAGVSGALTLDYIERAYEPYVDPTRTASLYLHSAANGESWIGCGRVDANRNPIATVSYNPDTDELTMERP